MKTKAQKVKLEDHTPESRDATEGGTPPAKPSPTALAGGEADRHPESYCHRCGGRNVGWFTLNDIWNRVQPGEGIVCPVCFVFAAEYVGIKPTAWCLLPEEDASVFNAAPVLYEALELLLTAIYAEILPLSEDIRQKMQQARAALAKARGESK